MPGVEYKPSWLRVITTQRRAVAEAALQIAKNLIFWLDFVLQSRDYMNVVEDQSHGALSSQDAMF